MLRSFVVIYQSPLFSVAHPSVYKLACSISGDSVSFTKSVTY